MTDTTNLLIVLVIFFGVFAWQTDTDLIQANKNILLLETQLEDKQLEIDALMEVYKERNDCVYSYEGDTV